jgi:polysaccharide pyruvyl transferase WcaK-like protein
MVTFGTGAGSTGFGDDEHPSLSGWREILNRFQMVGVRGPRSYAALAGIGVNNVQVVGDPALSLGPKTLPSLKERPTLAINVGGSAGDQYGAGACASYREIATIARQHIARGGDIVPVAMCQADCRFLRALLADAGIEHCPIRHPGSAEEFIEYIRGAACMIGVRLHSAVLASVAGTIPILLAYRDKCWDFMESMNLSRTTIRIKTGSNGLIQETLEYASNSRGLREMMFDRVRHWRATQVDYANRAVAILSSAC